ncbi:MAG TPA: Zn-dependent alcohol dehydrogenase [Acidimicrobiales bacterium]
MRAAVMERVDEPLVVDEIDVRDPIAGEVLVRVVACGACHSDLSVVDGSFPLPLPAVLGHEAAGVVEAVGDGVTAVRPGDQVVITPTPPCGRCYFCLRGDQTLCHDATMGLFTGTLPNGTTPYSRKGETVYRGLSAGAFSELTICPVGGVVKIPGDVDPAVACVIGCAVQTGVGAVLNTARVPEGATAFVSGAGGIGIAITQGLRLAAASRIIVADPVAERRQHALRFGATDVVDPTTDDVASVVHQLTGGIGVDYAFEGAGRAVLIEQALGLIRSGGTCVMVGAPPVDEGISIRGVVGFGATEKKLVGCLLGSVHSHRDIPRFIDLYQAGRLDLEGMITRRVKLDEVNGALDDLRNTRGIRTVVEMA